MTTSDKLFNRNFILISLATLLMFFAFNLVMPVIAIYVMERFGASASTAGVVVASYIITALLTRPFSGYLVDKYDRKKLYIIMYTIFALLFIGYIIASSISQIIITRILLGATFAIVTTACNTIAIDVTPPSRRGEGVGYFGAIIVISMAIGPMAGLYLMELMSYEGLFIVALISCATGVVVGSFVQTQPREHTVHSRLSWDRFFLFEATPLAIVMALVYFFYGSLMAYVSIYVRECGLDINSGNFFLLFSVGIIIARLLSGRYIARGAENILVFVGLASIIIAGGVFAIWLTEMIFPITSLILGFGFGLVAPPVQAMIVSLVSHARRGTANSTYFIALDFGSGMGMLTGGVIAQAGNGFHTTYIVGVILTILAIIIFALRNRN